MEKYNFDDKTVGNIIDIPEKSRTTQQTLLSTMSYCAKRFFRPCCTSNSDVLRCAQNNSTLRRGTEGMDAAAGPWWFEPWIFSDHKVDRS